MKTLKLDHSIAQKVRTGERTATWRLYDDKDIQVNDQIELIDKVEPDDPSTWQVIGVAHIDLIVEKRLSEVNQSDFEGHGPVKSTESLLKAYQKYYGLRVTLDTPVKMIHFSLARKQDSSAASAPKLKEAKLYADGGSRGNPGPSASGYVLLDMHDKIVVKNGVYLGVTTNNQAEYQALKFGVEDAHNHGIQKLHVYMDSLLVINQMKGIFKIKNRDLWPIYESIKDLAEEFQTITFTHVPRELNKLADAEVNIVLDERAR